MYSTTTNHALVEKTFALMFGDMLHPFMAARKRVGSETIAFLFFHMGSDLEIRPETLAALWVAELDQPVDHGLIELFVAMRDRVQNSPLLQWRLARTAKKAGIYGRVGQAHFAA